MNQQNMSHCSASRSPDLLHPYHREDATAQRRALAEHGFCILKDVLDTELVEVLASRLKAQAFAEHDAGLSGYRTPEQPTESVTQWVMLLLNKGERFVELATNDTVLGLARDLLGGECVLSDISARVTHPGSEAMDLHCDQWWLPAPSMPGDPHERVADIQRSVDRFGPPTRADRPIAPPAAVNAIYALEDVTADMGPTRFVPGSHLSGNLPDPDENIDAVSPPLAKGSAIFFDGRLWHGASPNVGTRSRWAVLVTYTGPQFRTILNLPLGLREEVVNGLTNELRALLGFKVWRGYGATEDFSAEFATPGSANTGILGDDGKRLE